MPIRALRSWIRSTNRCPSRVRSTTGESYGRVALPLQSAYSAGAAPGDRTRQPRHRGRPRNLGCRRRLRRPDPAVSRLRDRLRGHSRSSGALGIAWPPVRPPRDGGARRSRRQRARDPRVQRHRCRGRPVAVRPLPGGGDSRQRAGDLEARSAGAFGAGRGAAFGPRHVGGCGGALTRRHIPGSHVPAADPAAVYTERGRVQPRLRLSDEQDSRGDAPLAADEPRPLGRGPPLRVVRVLPHGRREPGDAYRHSDDRTPAQLHPDCGASWSATADGWARAQRRGVDRSRGDRRRVPARPARPHHRHARRACLLQRLQQPTLGELDVPLRIDVLCGVALPDRGANTTVRHPACPVAWGTGR